MIEITDPDLGKIIVTPNKRARNVTARRKADAVLLTVPYRFTRKDTIRAFESLKPRLLKITPKKTLQFTDDTAFRTYSFSVQIKRFNLTKSYKMTLKDEVLTIFVPKETDISSETSQLAIRKLIESALRFEAKRILPQKTEQFARKFGLSYSQVKVNSSRSRWGSCSRKRSINYSLYLMLLDERQINYVVLHELAHTVEMNHSPKFWKLLSDFCGEDAKTISKSLKKISSESYAYFAE